MQNDKTPARREEPAAQPIPGLATALLLTGLLVAFYRGAHMPNLWSVNYFLPNAIDGFHRRSLAGTLLYPFGDLRFHYHFIAAIQLLILAGLLAVVLRAVWRADERTRIIVALFFLGPAGGFLFNEAGYIDQLLVLMLIAALATANPHASRLIMFATLFMHEMALFFVVPLYGVCRWHDSKDIREVAATLLLCLAGFAVIYLFFQTVDRPVIDAFKQAFRAKADFQISSDYYDVFSNAFLGSRLRIYYRGGFLFEVALVLCLAALAGWALSRGASGRLKPLIAAAGALAAASPLALGVFGWDLDRWVFLGLSCGVFLLYWLRHDCGPRAQQAAMAVLVLFMAIGEIRYFDGLTPRDMQEGSVLRFLRGDLPAAVRQVPTY